MALSDHDARDGGGGIGVHVVEVGEEEESGAAAADEISPLLAEVGGNKPTRMTIFSVSYPKNRHSTKEMISRAAESEVAFLNQFALWVWNESRYSGFLCMASSSAIYYFMDVLLDIFSVQSIPLFETIFTRCFILVIMSLLWLRRTGQSLIIPTNVRKILIFRSLAGFLSLLSFIYSVQNLPLSCAVLLNFATPIIASIGAKIILKENLAFMDIGGLACSFLGLLFIFQPMLFVTGSLDEPGQASNTLFLSTRNKIFPIFAGIFSSTLGGISYCLVRAAAKATNQPVYTVLSFGILACPLSLFCAYTFQEFQVPSFFTFLLMIVLGILAFFAETLSARGLQLERIGKLTNILYLKHCAVACNMSCSCRRSIPYKARRYEITRNPHHFQ
ncbi:uncharacterized protein LOC109724636 isoform X2 [Ananas comosus]|uniref:Uncharacterized protein LOC109724636 isoform X2 n=1 Tax=Ananas comosus TaxID=4615 RepID=A0A6P5GMH1_ANACO|nr:uncharacterized protein LOC109724636 isoform X2 [Ananas comosus]